MPPYRIWILSFESRSIIKVGGLGEVPPNLGRALVRRGHDVEVIMPSHGVLDAGFASRHDVEEVMDNGRYAAYAVKDVEPRHVLLSGGLLDHRPVYDPGVLNEKVIEYANAVGAYALSSIDSGCIPHIIHCNDWHCVPALVKLKSILGRSRTIYHIHLLSGRTLDWLDPRRMGVSLEEKIVVSIGGRYTSLSIGEAIGMAWGNIDRLGGILADAVVTVSKHYLRDVLSNIGFDLADKAGVIYNGTDWSLERAYKDFAKDISIFAKALEQPSQQARRKMLRDTLLLNIDKLFQSGEPVIMDHEVRSILEDYRKYPFAGGGRVHAFREPGPLVIMTGRLTEQKGWGVLIRALDDIIGRVPDIRIILFPLAVGGRLDLVQSLIEYSRLYSENIRVVFGVAKKLYAAAHMAADVMAAPSLFEPFGIMALEAMAMGTPVVASKTGGLSETVLDIRRHGTAGTGLHVRPGVALDLADAVADLAVFMDLGYVDSSYADSPGLIRCSKLRSLITEDPGAPWRIRESCIRRASQFSWENSAAMAEAVYKRVLEEDNRAGQAG